MNNEIQGRQRFEKWMTIFLLGGMLACFCWVIATHYYIRASSDPHNWIKYAHNFRSEVLQSRWPYGFPLFLRMLLPITGPYYIFLVNFPLLIIAFFLLWKLGRATGPDRRALDQSSRYTGIAAVALALSADAREMIYYVNPYRDPLSYVLLLASVWLFIRALTKKRHWSLLASGLLLGLACSVREPSILMLLPMLLYGLIEWVHTKGTIPFWKSTGFFTAGFALALVPLVIQTYLATNQIFLPPQASIQASVVPGAHFRWEVFLNISHRAWLYYAEQQIWIPVLAVIGLLTAIWNRQRVILFLIAPATICYIVFYSFYWTFVPRYFYLATLLLCLLGGYGIGGMLHLLKRCLPDRWGRPLVWIIILLLCALSARQLKHVQQPQRPLQVADARAFANRLAPLIATNAVVFAQRNLCELIQVIVLRDSYAWSPEPDLILQHVKELQAAGKPVYTMKVPSPFYPYGDTIHLYRLYDLEPIETFVPEHYNLAGFATEPFTLLKVLPASCQQWSADIQTRGWSPGRGWLALDLGYLSDLDPRRTAVNIAINGEDRTNAVAWQGSHILEIGQTTDAPWPETIRVDVVSDGFLPANIRMNGGDLSMPIELDFDLHATFDQRWRWRGGIIQPDLNFRKPRLRNEASILIPVPSPNAARVLMEWQFRSVTKESEGTENIFIYENETLLGTALLARDQEIHEFLIDLPTQTDAQERWIRIVREQPQTDMTLELEIHRLLLHRPSARKAIDINIGATTDAPYILSGFYHREDEETPRAFRWTKGQAELRLSTAQTDTDMMLRIHYSTEHAPAVLRPIPITVRWNGNLLTADEIQMSADGIETVWTGHVSAADVLPENSVTLESTPWSPQNYGSPDTRQLGVMLRQIECKPIE